MLESYTSDRQALVAELAEFEQLMSPNTALREKEDILPFFRRNRHLAAYLGYANNYLAVPDLLGIEHNLLGFRCDIAVGDSVNGQFTLVELEDAAKESVFRRDPKRQFPRWAPRYEAGFSQLVDWTWRIEHEKPPSIILQSVFGTTSPKIHYVLVIGRDRWISAAEGARLEWRRRYNGIHGQQTTIWTYDDFLGFVQRRLVMAQTT